LYPAAAVYLNVVTLSCRSVPCEGFWETPELCIAPGIRIGKLHVCPDLTAKYAVISMPNTDGLPVTRQSTAKADTGVRLKTAAIASVRIFASCQDELASAGVDLVPSGTIIDLNQDPDDNPFGLACA